MTDPLEKRIASLSPEQRRSVEDYIDFLLSRPAVPAGSPGNDPAGSPPVAPPPPVLTLTDLPQPVTAPEPEKTLPIPSSAGTEPSCSGFQEIAAEKEDTIAQAYMDYGQFESPQKAASSPADEAVQRVRVKLDRKGQNDPTRNVLDWIE